MNLIRIYEAKRNIFNLSLEDLSNFVEKVEAEYFGVNRSQHLEDLQRALSAKSDYMQYLKEQTELKGYYRYVRNWRYFVSQTALWGRFCSYANQIY